MRHCVVSIVIPAHNASLYIGECLESVIRQDFQSWEVIVVEDNCTDDTFGVVEKYHKADPRISHIVNDCFTDSGAYMPRLKGIQQANGKYILLLDADDVLASDYVGSLLKDVREFDADAAFGTMYSFKNNISECEVYLNTSVETGRKYTGEILLGYTLDGWRAGFNGGLYKKEFIQKMMTDFYDYVTKSFPDLTKGYPHIDEGLTRYMLLQNPIIVFDDSRYYYRMAPGSVTHQASWRRFSYLYNNRVLHSLMSKRLDRNSDEWAKFQRQTFHSVIDSLQLMYSSRLSPEDSRRVKRMISESRDNLDWDELKGKVSHKLYVALRYAPWLFRFFSTK